MATADKAPGAFRTIGELSVELGVPQHILRYWETKFPQLRPLQRAGNRRYYRAEDVTLARRIHQLLSREGYTVRGVQQLLASKRSAVPEAQQPVEPVDLTSTPSVDLARLKALRDRLADALAA